MFCSQASEILKLVYYTTSRYFDLNKNISIDLLSLKTIKDIDLSSLKKEVDKDNKSTNSLLVGILYLLSFSEIDYKQGRESLNYWFSNCYDECLSFVNNVSFRSDTNDLGLKMGLSCFGLIQLLIDTENYSNFKEITV